MQKHINYYYSNNSKHANMYQNVHRSVPNFANDPEYSNLPTELTNDGIRQLFANNSNSGSLSTRQQYILQIIKIAEDYSQNRMCHLSDGFCYINCILTGQARLKHIKGQLQVFDIVKICKQDVIMLGLERNPSLQLCNLNILGMRLLCSIGQPVAYMAYSNNNFVNTKGSLLIADGQKIQHALDITQLTQNFPHIPTKWILKAKVFKKPANINVNKPLLIIQLMDEKQKIIEGVFFGQVAIQANKKLIEKRWYLFNNGQIKSKKNNIEELQIKFTEQSQIIPIQAMKSTNPTNSGSNNGEDQLTIKDITNNLNNSDGRLITIVGKVFRIKKLSKGRCIQILDKNSDVIEIVLWEQISDEVKQGVTYVFQNLRTKVYNSTVSLQSIRSKTSVKKSAVQIQRANTSSANQIGRRVQNKMAMSKYKELRQTQNLLNVNQLTQLKIVQKQYKDVYGFLVINTMYMDNKNFFKLQCPNCNANNQQVVSNPLMCKKCSSTNPSVRWNIRCHIMGEKQQIKCVINQDLCQRLLKMSSIEGFKKLSQDKDNIRRKVQEISHLEGIFRIKINPYKDNVYYNIVDVYKNESTILLKKSYKELKVALKKFNQM